MVRTMLGVVLASAFASAGLAAEFPAFRMREIDRIGKQMGQTSLVDVDRDGDLDWIAGCNGGTVWWFEYQSPDRWVRHVVGQAAGTEVGGTAFDVDGDGWVDQVSGATWFRNPGSPRSGKFARHENGAIRRAHDNVAADIDGDGRLDVVMMSDREGLFWYRIPDDPTRPWQPHRVGPGVHGGVAPRGVDDIDGDGDADIVRSTGWFENADGKGVEWRWRENLDGGHDGKFPSTTRAWLVDLDGDGDLDAVLCDNDRGGNDTHRVHWFDNRDGRGGEWQRCPIADGKGDLHSLAVADFDNDGDADVFSGEGPLGFSGPDGKRRWFIWENVDGRGGAWRERIILEGPRCHEAVAADVDADGDIDICSKPWDGDLHIYLRNLLVEEGSRGANRDTR